MLSKASQKRITFAQLSWFGLMFVAGLTGVARGAPIWLCAIITVVSVFPFLIWAISRLSDESQRPIFDDFYIISWTLVALFTMAVGGGALTPLTAVLVLGPIACVMIGREHIAADVAVLGLLAYVVSIIAGFLGWSGFVPASWGGLIAPWAIAAMVQIVILLWACLPRLQQVQEDIATVAETETEGAPTPFEPGRAPDLVPLDLSAPVLLVQVASEGRIRRVEGPENLRWKELAAGQIATKALGDLEEDTLIAPNEASFHVLKQPADLSKGGWVALLPDSEIGSSTPPAMIEGLETDLARAREELNERTAFFAGLGHDLKTPLNAILGFADLMKAEIRGPLPDAYKDYPSIIHESGQDLMLLVEDILDLAKADANAHQLDMEPIDLVASAASVVRQLSDQAERAGVKLALEDSDEVWAEADARAVRQIWQNLVSNAIKYSSKGGVVTLSAARAAGAVAISVKDRGAGMDQADLDRIAQPFAQGHNSKGRAGTGLGLAVVHRFAELHGGKVMIDTAPGKGTRVRVTLPMADMSGYAAMEDAAQ